MYIHIYIIKGVLVKLSFCPVLGRGVRCAARLWASRACEARRSLTAARGLAGYRDSCRHGAIYIYTYQLHTVICICIYIYMIEYIHICIISAPLCRRCVPRHGPRKRSSIRCDIYIYISPFHAVYIYIYIYRFDYISIGEARPFVASASGLKGYGNSRWYCAMYIYISFSCSIYIHIHIHIWIYISIGEARPFVASASGLKGYGQSCIQCDDIINIYAMHTGICMYIDVYIHIWIYVYTSEARHSLASTRGLMGHGNSRRYGAIMYPIQTVFYIFYMYTYVCTYIYIYIYYIDR